jgi:hypothetical protein
MRQFAVRQVETAIDLKSRPNDSLQNRSSNQNSLKHTKNPSQGKINPSLSTASIVTCNQGAVDGNARRLG